LTLLNSISGVCNKVLIHCTRPVFFPSQCSVLLCNSSCLELL